MYRDAADITSHLQFIQCKKEFFGPEFPEKCKALRACTTKGADFSKWKDDAEAVAARERLVSQTIERVVLAEPAARPWESGKPFELFFDASDLAWCVVLCQRGSPGGPLRIIAFRAKSFHEAATRWSDFEREFYGVKEGYKAVEKWVAGFTVFARFHDKNIERAESVLDSRRASKKLMN